ncbi:DNA starvation/stationary phase protection protein [Chlorobiota bacterium]|nr:DNA starvation/stationary phase protection protein [Chlorobiota bacterium]
MNKQLDISEKDKEQIVQGLSQLLADTFSIYIKTHNFHWNVSGPMFVTLHTLFEQQYTELALAIDIIAVRIRALGAFAPGSFKAFQDLTSIPDMEDIPDALTMIALLVEDNETIIKTARSIIPLADKAYDTPTADLATARILVHEKTAWMLTSLLG